jgi:Zn-dependent protease
MLRHGFSIGKLFGIPIKIDLSWVIIFLWVTISLGVQYTAPPNPITPTILGWSIAIITSLLFFTSVLIHELSHSLIARSYGVPVRDITLFIFGGVSQITEEPRTAREEAIMAGAGPLTSLVLGGLFGGLFFLVQAVLPLLQAPVGFLAIVNLSLGLFNLIPGFPLDGGRVLRAILWGARHNLEWATRIASFVGQGVAYLFIIYGIYRAINGDWLNGLWLVFIGLFLDGAARSSYAQLTLRNLLAGHTASEVMSQGCVSLPQQLTLDLVVEQYLMPNPRRCFTVTGPQGVIGLLTPQRVTQVSRDRWPQTHVGEVAIPLSEVKAVRPDTSLWQTLQEMTSEGVNQLPVIVDGQLAGMISRENLLTYIRDRSMLTGA